MNHIELTIADLTAARNQCDFLIQSLREFQSGVSLSAALPTASPLPPAETSVHIVTAPAPTPSEIRARVSQVRVPRGTAKTSKRHKHHPRGDSTEALTAALGKISEPFSAVTLAAAAKTDGKTASNFIVRRCATGVIVKQGRGKYVRATTKTATPSKPVAAQVQPSNVTVAVSRAIGLPAVTADAKPTTVGAAMKMAIRNISEFTGAQLRDALRADADYGKLLEQSPTAFCGNLIYWSNQGYLDKDGDGALEAVFTVTKVGREWFNK